MAEENIPIMVEDDVSVMADEIIPILDFPPDTERTKRLWDLFVNTFKCAPAFCVSVPGRINLMGDHIDYCGYPTLSMAIERDILLAVGGDFSEMTHLVNVCPKYEEFRADSWQFMRKKANEYKWYDYIMCGIANSANKIFNTHVVKGLKIAVCGTIPSGAGLSNSSALVCGGALAYVHVNGGSMSKLQLATVCAGCETMMGTASCATDHAITFFAQEGCASHILSNSMTIKPIKLPKDAVFVVAYSLVEPKKFSSKDFNNRTKTCELAAHVMSILYDIEYNNSILTLSKLQRKLRMDLVQMRDGCEMLGNSFMDFNIKCRAIHVIEEAIRVERFREICETSNKHEDWSIKLGKLMRESHQSLSCFYECSHSKVDTLVELSDKFGVYSRLTGDGWGGCIVALCTNKNVLSYIQMLEDLYYSKRNLMGRSINDLVFITRPNRGASIYEAYYSQRIEVINDDDDSDLNVDLNFDLNVDLNDDLNVDLNDDLNVDDLNVDSTVDSTVNSTD